jgi:hypothetical protein
MAACKCKPPSPLKIRESQLVRVEFGRTQQTMIYPIDEYCTGCRGVLSPEQHKWARVAETDHKAEIAVYQGIHAANKFFGTANDAATSKFISWADLASYIRIPSVRRSELITNFTAIKEEELRGRLRRDLGLSPLTKDAIIKTPIGDVKVAHSTVDHLFTYQKSKEGNSIDADHVQMWPLVLATLHAPIEIWEAPAAQEKADRYRFLAMYQVGEQLQTHLVIVTKETMTAITAYRLDPQDDPMRRADRKRALISCYLKWKK